jgi:hypothetical protein
MVKLNDLKGKTFGLLTVVGRSENSRNGTARWHVKCNCGNEKTVYASHLVAGNTKSCGCLSAELASSRSFKGVGKVGRTYFSSIKRGAMGDKGRSPIEFSITLEYISDLFDRQNYKCALSGLAINVGRGGTASLDRIDSSKGYIEGNVQWLHKDVNMMKRAYSQEYFIHLCKSISNAADGCVVV